MFTIKKMRDDQTISFAADELKKYLWSMMPKSGNTPISLEPGATEGFRLGLLEDFGLPNEAADPTWDDVVHIDTTAEGGILAGSNPRSVLFAVYRFLRLNGCRWFYPGPEGEYVPMKAVEGQKYHHMADHRVRGYTIEGDPSMEQVANWVDYQAKLELNMFVPSDPYVYLRRYYERRNIGNNRPAEVVTAEQCDQWLRTLESEALKRGMLLKEGGHGNIPCALGLNPADREEYRTGEKQLPEHVYQYLALMKGKRTLFRNDIYYTNLCMSQPEVRRMLINRYIENIQNNPHLCMTGIGFADGTRNHCECENCRKLNPSDFQIMIANELDEELTARGIDTKVALSTYVDMMFPPIREKIKNPDRFWLQFTPISRSYSASIKEDTVLPEPLPYVRNAWKAPKGIDQCMALFHARRKDVKVPAYAYEYHFWRAQFRDPGLMIICRRLYEDVRSLKLVDIDGYQQDGSNKHFFPHGFHQFIHAETLVNRDCDYDALLDDYFSLLFGEDYQEVIKYLTAVSEAFGEKYMAGEEPAAGARDPLHNPERAEKLEQVYELAAVARNLVNKNRKTPVRVQALAWRLLERHAEFAAGVAEVFQTKARGYDKLALEKMDAFIESFGRHDYELERWMDFGLFSRLTRSIIVKMPFVEQ
ncbi:MAG: DUF4838 domain-containing protein [Oscillospiraceae bacterium]|nr:DUF4838 domain-containing protein [Oscillospiraceae bacterium]